MPVKVRVRPPPKDKFIAFRGRMLNALERSALIAVDQVSTRGKDAIRGEMKAAGLGNLGNAIASGSDLQKGRVTRTPFGFRVSSWIYIRGAKNERTTGAIAAYTRGATITPRRSEYLWIATPELGRKFAGGGKYRKRLTPATYRANGLEEKIGPLVFVRGRSAGEALLIVRDISVDRFGRGGSRGARRLPKRGRLGDTRVQKQQIVAFIGIRQTTRNKRLDPVSIIRREVGQFPNMVADFINR